MSWSPAGDRLAYFARTEKEQTLILQNVVTEQDREADRAEDGRRARSRPTSARTASEVAFSGAARRDRRHLHRRPRDAARSRNLTNDAFGDYAPTCVARRQVDRLPRARQRQREAVPARPRDRARRRSSPSARTTTAARSSSTTTRSCSRRRRSIPAEPIEPEVARNGNIYNIWTLNLKTGELRQYTDALDGNLSPVVLRDDEAGADRVRHLLQGRVRPPHARAQGAAAHGRDARTSARPARSSTSRRRSRTRWCSRTTPQEGHVREDVPRGPAAGERRRHERRRRLRRHAGHASPTCSATSSSTSSPRRSRSTGRCRSRT